MTTSRPDKHPVLRAEQEVECAKAIEVGLFAQHRLDHTPHLGSEDRADLLELTRLGQQATDTLILCNQRLVAFFARRRFRAHAHGGLDLDDLIEAGTLGLIRAVRKFDYTRGCKFSTYAHNWISNFMARAIAQYRGGHLDPQQRDDLARVYITTDVLTASLGRPPTREEIAAEAEFTLTYLDELLAAAANPVSLDAALGDDDFTAYDLVADNGMAVDDHVAASDTARRILDAVNALPPRQQTVARLSLGIDAAPLDICEIAKKLRVREAAVQLVLHEALATLRQAATEALADAA